MDQLDDEGSSWEALSTEEKKDLLFARCQLFVVERKLRTGDAHDLVAPIAWCDLIEDIGQIVGFYKPNEG